jgi:ParB/RepB/Spo0J family partition protein
LQGDPNHEVELIYGARRLFVARHLNLPLSVELRRMSDREASVAMDIENRQRTDISAYERGRSYARWLRAGLYESQEELARALAISKSHVSRLMKIAQLPSAIIGAFESPCDICEGWGLALTEVLEDPRRREQTLRVARALGNNTARPPAREVYRMLLLASGPGRKAGAQLRDEVVKASSGAALFRIKQQRSTVAILLPLQGLSAKSMHSIRRALTAILEPQNDNSAVNESPLPEEPGGIHDTDTASVCDRTARTRPDRCNSPEN